MCAIAASVMNEQDIVEICSKVTQSIQQRAANGSAQAVSFGTVH
jgi:hypothetical protein